MSRREESQQRHGHGGENTGISAAATAAVRRVRAGAKLNGTQVLKPQFYSQLNSTLLNSTVREILPHIHVTLVNFLDSSRNFWDD